MKPARWQTLYERLGSIKPGWPTEQEIKELTLRSIQEWDKLRAELTKEQKDLFELAWASEWMVAMCYRMYAFSSGYTIGRRSGVRRYHRRRVEKNLVDYFFEYHLDCDVQLAEATNK